ncbi:limonene-1,2-epoxide hydrolase family protein [Sphingobium baderi]|uniref:Limonene-1,2-epoxide hydrolase domain-containing protein n=1 Tax=Sphingobium baderi TaxID=1332080 RepID=A0A0S3EYR6_9SPHN|nr:limonene-1,2-epoxide hydrolase family protein [Sphingobium baderi]ALR20574.1 hypothetical protein ATN00_09910 [Sphingobium baderi]
MSVEAEAKIREFLSVFHTGSLDTKQLSSYFSESATYLHRARHAEPLRGRSAIIEELEQQFTRYSDCACQIHAIASTDRQVFTERTDEVVMRRDGKRVSVLLCGIFDLDMEYRITNWREYWDMDDVLKQTSDVGA